MSDGMGSSDDELRSALIGYADCSLTLDEAMERIMAEVRAVALSGERTQDALRAANERLREDCESARRERDAWMNGVADVVEPLGFDREAACGPADLLPGLRTLDEALAARDATIEELRTALAPFAEMADYCTGYEDESTVGPSDYADVDCTVGDVRRAAALLALLEGEETP